MKHILRTLLPFALLLIMLATLLLGCGNDSTSEDIPATLPEDERLVLLKDGQLQFQVVRSDLLKGSDFQTQCAIQTVAELQDLMGNEPPLHTDYTGKGGAPEIPCEILIGPTNRPASQEAEERMASEDYGIYVKEQKLCIVGRNARSIQVALDRLLHEFLYIEDTVMYVSNQLHVFGSYSLPEGSYIEVAPGYVSSMSKAERYDESVALACLQGIMNRESPHKVYVNGNSETEDWLTLLRGEGFWLQDVEFIKLFGFSELLEYADPYLKCVVIWDEAVPATLNVACTVAGVEDGVVLTPSMYEAFKDRLADKRVISLVGQFDGSETGSAKNDAYRWAIRNYLEKGLCSTDYICSYIDPWSHRQRGDVSYVVVRDWGIYHRAFVYDLSPWGDEAPLDEDTQEIGTDKETLLMIYDTMLILTQDTAPYEVCGFFEHQKYSAAGQNKTSNHSSVHTEWEYAALMTPYNGYHNTCIDASWNESFHGLYDGAKQLTSNRPEDTTELETGVAYVCFFMGDYDSTHPVYRYLKTAWDDPRRGEIPFAWAINPNLIETYPDLIEYYYKTATPNDYFVSDASAAGYFMPSQVPDALWPKTLAHHITYFKRADMTIAPMVLDRKGMDADDLAMMVQIAPDGIGTVLQNKNYMYEDTPVAALLGGGYDRYDPVKGAENLAGVIDKQFKASNSGASLNLLRCVWSTPSVMCEMLELYQKQHPDVEVVVVDIYTYFDLIRQDLNW